MAGRRKRELTEEERALWRKVASTATPIRAPIEREPAHSSPVDHPPAPPKPVIRPKPLPASAPPAKPRMAHSGLDRRTAERLRKGRRDPDARLDLHGMTADRAHAALNRFIAESRRAGLRCILVITGKGGPAEPGVFGEPAPGVLRREAPVWLGSAPLSSQIVSVTQAHPRHGGGGALYVYLKRPPGRG